MSTKPFTVLGTGVRTRVLSKLFPGEDKANVLKEAVSKISFGVADPQAPLRLIDNPRP